MLRIRCRLLVLGVYGRNALACGDKRQRNGLSEDRIGPDPRSKFWVLVAATKLTTCCPFGNLRLVSTLTT